MDPLKEPFKRPETILREAGGTTLVGVDATRIHKVMLG